MSRRTNRRTCDGIRCAANGSRMRVIGRTGRSFRRRSSTRWRRHVPGGTPPKCPSGDYDVAVFENLFPTLSADPDDPPASIVETAPGARRCEVVVFTQDATASLGSLPLWHLELLFDVWADRYVELGARPEVAVRVPVREPGRGGRRHAASSARTDLRVSVRAADSGARAVAAARALRRARTGPAAVDRSPTKSPTGGACCTRAACVAFMPAFARYSYEVWVAPSGPLPRSPTLDAPTSAPTWRARSRRSCSSTTDSGRSLFLT